MRKTFACSLFVALMIGPGGPVAEAVPGTSAPSPATFESPLLLARHSAKRSKRRVHTPRNTRAVKRQPSRQAPKQGLDMEARPRRGRYTFEDTRITGQTPKQGAIQLIARQRTRLLSMVKEREAYRQAILRTVYR